MDVTKPPVLAVFEAKQRLEVPLFQRQYVWNEEQQWFPLWEDIARKFIETLEDRKDAPVHFLGAMVLDQKKTNTGHVVVRQIIDGQQRLTTLQLFMAAYRDFCKAHEIFEIAEECKDFLLNDGRMANPDVDQFKVWPTQLDRAQFIEVIKADSHVELLKRNPLRKKPYTRNKFEPRPRMIEAYLFFYEQLNAFFMGQEGEAPLKHEIPLEERLDKCLQAMRSVLMVVVIDLEKGDDPQVIFETLNARGQPLLPADLLRNYIFFRANNADLDVEAAYEKYWRPFDDEFWRKEIRQGRLLRPRSDLFMQHFLASRQGHDIPIKHLYVEYRHWLEGTKPFATVEEELATLSRQGAHFRRIVDPQPNDNVYELAHFLNVYDIGTAYPFLLTLLEANLSADEWKKISTVLESFLLRRAVCGLSTKNYNKIFLSLAKNVKGADLAHVLRTRLLEQEGENVVWPNDAVFSQAWMEGHAYNNLSNPKLVHIYRRLNQTFMSSKSENLLLSQPLSIEHIMPMNWEENWLLLDGSKGMDIAERLDSNPEDVRHIASTKRDNVLHTLGNLTILTTELNSAQSNLGWKEKRPELMRHSLLPINQLLAAQETWDEATIYNRGQDLLKRALTLWPR